LDRRKICTLVRAEVAPLYKFLDVTSSDLKRDDPAVAAPPSSIKPHPLGG
jgi:hypothetical protein